MILARSFIGGNPTRRVPCQVYSLRCATKAHGYVYKTPNGSTFSRKPREHITAVSICPHARIGGCNVVLGSHAVLSGTIVVLATRAL